MKQKALQNIFNIINCANCNLLDKCIDNNCLKCQKNRKKACKYVNIKMSFSDSDSFCFYLFFSANQLTKLLTVAHCSSVLVLFSIIIILLYCLFIYGEKTPCSCSIDAVMKENIVFLHSLSSAVSFNSIKT